MHKCCVVYGTLPPDVRGKYRAFFVVSCLFSCIYTSLIASLTAEQARRFNDPDSEYQVLVASDAIGMGLNLSIKRIIFNSMIKTNGEKLVRLLHTEVKQIAGE